MNRKWWILAVIFILAVGALLLVVFAKRTTDEIKVTDFNSCVAAGNPVMESYPRQCKDQSGQTFTEVINRSDDQSSNTSNNVSSDDISDDTATISVFFSKEPQSNDDFTYTVRSNRQTTRKDVGTFAIEQLIAGPNQAETTEGLISPIKLSGDSNCDSKDFNLVIVDGKATIKFCKNLNSAGVGQDTRIIETITQTLKQFPTVDKVIILTKDDDCFGDLSGLNNCKI